MPIDSCAEPLSISFPLLSELQQEPLVMAAMSQVIRVSLYKIS